MHRQGRCLIAVVENSRAVNARKSDVVHLGNRSDCFILSNVPNDLCNGLKQGASASVFQKMSKTIERGRELSGDYWRICLAPRKKSSCIRSTFLPGVTMIAAS